MVCQNQKVDSGSRRVNAFGKYTSLPYSEVLQRNAGEMRKAVERAEVQNEQKAKLIELSWYLLISGLALVFIFLLLSTFLAGAN